MWLVDNSGILALVRVTNTVVHTSQALFEIFFFPIHDLIITDATAFTNANFGQGYYPILLDDVACTVYESKLIDCPHDSNTADCTHSQDAGVRCVSRELHSFMYLYILPLLMAFLPILQDVHMAASD